MEIREKLKSLRESKKISRKRVGVFLGKDGSTIRDFETGRIRIPLESFLKMCEYYEISPMALIDDTKTILITENDEKQIDQALEVLKRFKTQISNQDKIITFEKMSKINI